MLNQVLSVREVSDASDSYDVAVINESFLDNTDRRLVNLNNASVNIENSRDVVIGNAIHHYHASVTIQQIIRDDVREEISNHFNDRGHSNSTTSVLADNRTTRRLYFSRRYLIIYSAIAFSLAIVVILAVFLFSSNIDNSKNDIINSTKKPNASSTNTSRENSTLDFHEKPSYTFGNNSNLNGCKIVEEEDWGVKRNLEDIVLKHPIPQVIVSHSVTPFCDNFKSCKRNTAQMQQFHISNGSPDIGYNFIIGGDGNIYVGRGWNARNFHKGNHSIGLNFIGNYFRDELTPKMIQCAKAILAYGVDTKQLTDDYKLVCHNQTSETLSPGPNVCGEIKKWPHYLSGKVDRNFLYNM